MPRLCACKADCFPGGFSIHFMYTTPVCAILPARAVCVLCQCDISLLLPHKPQGCLLRAPRWAQCIGSGRTARSRKLLLLLVCLAAPPASGQCWRPITERETQASAAATLQWRHITAPSPGREVTSPACMESPRVSQRLSQVILTIWRGIRSANRSGRGLLKAKFASRRVYPGSAAPCASDRGLARTTLAVGSPQARRTRPRPFLAR